MESAFLDKNCSKNMNPLTGDGVFHLVRPVVHVVWQTLLIYANLTNLGDSTVWLL